MDVFVNDRFLREEEAVINVGDLGVQRGYGVFDFFRTREYEPLWLDDYLDRFFYSVELLRLQCPYRKDEIKGIIRELVRRNDIETSGMRMILTGGNSPDSYGITEGNFFITHKPIELPTAERFEEGLSIITRNYQRELPQAKSINYLMGVYLQEEIAEAGADDVLYLNDGAVLEFPRANVFIVTQENKVVTPRENVLWGVTRKRVLDIAKQLYATEERKITFDELKAAKEIFFTSTTKRILPVVVVDGKVVGVGRCGEVTRQLYNEFLRMEESAL